MSMRALTAPSTRPLSVTRYAVQAKTRRLPACGSLQVHVDHGNALVYHLLGEGALDQVRVEQAVGPGL